MRLKYSLLLIGAMALLIAVPACTQVKASDVGQNLQGWVNELLKPSKTTLEKAETGYKVKGNLKNRPQNLMMLWEMQTSQLVFVDSVRTDAEGNFTFSGNLKEPIFCQLQWGESNSTLVLLLENTTDAKLEINAEDGTYGLQGKGIQGSTDVKELLDINNSYNLKFQALQSKAGALPQTQEGYLASLELQKEYTALYKLRNKDIADVTLTKKKSLVPFFVIGFQLLQDYDLAFLENAYTQVTAFNPASKYAVEMKARYEKEKVLAIGAIAPEIKFKTPEGTPLALSSLRGKVVLIDFWASWCGPCRKENPYNRVLYNKYKSKGFEIYGVSLDDNADRWKQAIKADSLAWKHVSDLAGWGSAAAKLYNVSSIPATYLIDAKGRIISKGLRGEELNQKLEEYFATKPKTAKP